MQFNVICQSCPNKNCPVKYCSPEWQDKISNQKNLVIYPKGQYVIVEDSLVMGAFFIQEGKVKVVSSNFRGKEQTVRLASNGHMVGHMGIGHETYPIGAVALEDSKICFLDNKTLYDAFMENPQFTFQVMMFYSRELRKSELRAKCFAQMNNEEKVIFGLIYMIDTFGIAQEDQTINISLARQEIADIVGTNAEQVSRAFAFLKGKKIIDTKEKRIQIINTNELIRLITCYLKPSDTTIVSTQFTSPQ